MKRICNVVDCRCDMVVGSRWLIPNLVLGQGFLGSVVGGSSGLESKMMTSHCDQEVKLDSEAIKPWSHKNKTVECKIKIGD